MSTHEGLSKTRSSSGSKDGPEEKRQRADGRMRKKRKTDRKKEKNNKDRVGNNERFRERPLLLS